MNNINKVVKLIILKKLDQTWDQQNDQTIDFFFFKLN